MELKLLYDSFGAPRVNLFHTKLLKVPEEVRFALSNWKPWRTKKTQCRLSPSFHFSADLPKQISKLSTAQGPEKTKPPASLVPKIHWIVISWFYQFMFHSSFWVNFSSWSGLANPWALQRSKSPTSRIRRFTGKLETISRAISIDIF